MYNPKTIVIDNGSSSCKAGFAGDDDPTAVVPSTVGCLRYLSFFPGGPKIDNYVGDDAYSSLRILALNYPIKHGEIWNYNHMEDIWNHIFFKKLHVDPSEYTVILSTALKSSRFQREKMIQVMFETFNVPSFYLSSQPLLSLYSFARLTGLVAEIGAGVSQFAPVSNCKGIDAGYMKNMIGGSDIDNYLEQSLKECDFIKDNSILDYEKQQMIRDIKEKHCYVSLDYNAELHNPSKNDVSYALPDNKSITLGSERFRCPEILFNPQINGFEFDGIAQTIVKSIQQCEIDEQSNLYANILLAGGTTLLEGFQERIEKDIVRLAPPNMNVKVVASPDRRYATWIGGSVLGCITAFHQMVITRSEYDDVGPPVIYGKCF